MRSHLRVLKKENRMAFKHEAVASVKRLTSRVKELVEAWARL